MIDTLTIMLIGGKVFYFCDDIEVKFCDIVGKHVNHSRFIYEAK